MYLLVLSLATLGVSMNYTDYLARNISLPLSAALYSRNSSKCLQKRLKTSEVEWQHEGNVSSFLKQAFEELWIEGGMNGSFQQIMKEQRDKEILITGHSFGGGLAALIAYDIAKKELVKKDKVTLITLGQSMVGDEDFAKAYEEQVKHSFRVVRRGDSIPHVPGRNKSYEYNGREIS
ncbi:hypothetical protein Y032_0118g761 [Ancylostoma ceylanicum]|nr:hypothetical protein Y032_0118g761 [Ancylostoma ceylanicum]